jgi:DNA-3-methyladenine glycosylase II
MGVRLVSDRGHAARRSKKNAAMLDDLAAQARFLWGLDDDAERHHAAMASDPDLAPLLERFGALRIVRAPDLYEALLVAGIGQQVSVPAAIQELRGLRERPSEKALRTIAERWRGWRSYAAFYLWMTLQSRAL